MLAVTNARAAVAKQLRKLGVRRRATVPSVWDNEYESKEARAERSLAQLEARLEVRRRWREALHLAGLIGVPLLLAVLLVRQARVSTL